MGTDENEVGLRHNARKKQLCYLENIDCFVGITHAVLPSLLEAGTLLLEGLLVVLKVPVAPGMVGA